MNTVFDAVWYDPKKCEAKAIAAGWKPDSSDGFLDVYMPEEDPEGHDFKRFKTLDEAVGFAKSLVAKGGDFWGQARVDECEIVPRASRCRYCVCGGVRLVRYHYVDETGIVSTETASDDCFEEA